MVAGAWLFVVEQLVGPVAEAPALTKAVLLGPLYFLVVFVGTFTTAVIVALATGHFRGERPTIGEGVEAAMGLALLLLFVPVAGVVGLVFTVAPPLGALVGVVALGMFLACATAFSGIYRAAL